MTMITNLCKKPYYFIPFLIICGILIFFSIMISGVSYNYYLKTQERIEKLDEKLHQENEKLKKENKRVTRQLLSKEIDNEGNIREYDTNNGKLLKITDKYNTVTEYISNGKRIKETLINGVWTEFNPVNDKMIKRKNIDGSLEEFDENEKKIKETQYYKETGKIKSLLEFDVNTGKKAKETFYESDGKTVNFIVEYDPETETKIKQTDFNEKITEFDRNTGYKTKITFPDGQIEEFNSDELLVRTISRGKEMRIEYFPGTNRKIKEILPNGEIIEYDPNSGKKIKSILRDGKIKKYALNK